ncbi:hypothetical protein COY90_01600 [Candidatus Roizmanbacteria bacterium CG_4_10_14_0_8_um_filter_39_9]|uniref:DUF5680 domain-containing protein n=1 Tax=Candidatus Roizmanbacteria bacterium CG_4_10_14_0_8_um_filter_39_9 TaxID=1974829 RepID=A0A2M7QEG6_9BACT|nr:MAG: hypothetical protein COY90_01600 [Candidatus Roizmanbacteria bacterium CG_4_10_14_0_8_um_filter_39_9]
MTIDPETLYLFIIKALRSTYATLGVEEVSSNKDGFKELIFQEGTLSYKDSYSGFFKSRGFEVVSQNGAPIWMSSYGGGMTKHDAKLAFETFTFLKKVFLADTLGFKTFRGPHSFSDGLWDYYYSQEGDITEFHGHEEIYYNHNLVFYHKTIGGEIREK